MILKKLDTKPFLRYYLAIALCYVNKTPFFEIYILNLKNKSMT